MSQRFSLAIGVVMVVTSTQLVAAQAPGSPVAPNRLGMVTVRPEPTADRLTIAWPTAAMRRGTSERLIIGGVVGAVAGLVACTAISNIIEEEGGFHTCTAKGNVLFGLGGAAVGVLAANATR
jgi:hypothetical protein